jgi:hypothetical protein
MGPPENWGRFYSYSPRGERGAYPTPHWGVYWPKMRYRT